MRSFISFIVLIVIGLLSGYLVSQHSHPFIFMGFSAFLVFAISFINIEIGLYILIFAMLLSPEFLSGDTGGASLGRGVTLRLEDFLLVIIGLSWFAKNSIFKELGLFLKTPLNRPILFYILACVISTGIGIMTGTTTPLSGFFFVLKYFEYYIIFFMLINQAESSDQIKRFIFCLFLTCFIVSVIGIYQIPEGGRVSAPFEGEVGEPNTFGGYLIFIGIIAAGLFTKLDLTKHKLLIIALILFIIPPFLFTQSRVSYVSLIPGILVLGYLTEKKVISIGIILISLLISPLFLPDTVKKRIAFTFTQQEHVGQHVEIGEMRLDTSTSARIISWKGAFDGWIKRPIFGYGVAGFGFLDAQYPRVLVEAGIIGLIAFIYLLYSIYKLAFNNLSKLKTPYFKGITIGFIAGYTALIFHSLAANTFIIVRIMEPFWFFVGIITILPVIEEKEGLELPEKKKLSFNSRFST